MELIKKLAWGVALLFNAISMWTIIKIVTSLTGTMSIAAASEIAPMVVMFSLVPVCAAFALEMLAKPAIRAAENTKSDA